MAKFKATLKMKKHWTTEFIKKATVDMILEAFADEILSGEIDEIFEITIEEATPEEVKDIKTWLDHVWIKRT